MPMMSTPPRWSTASFGEAADTTPMELAALGEHLAQCSARNGRLATLQCWAERLREFVSGRLITTLALLAALIAACLLAR